MQPVTKEQPTDKELLAIWDEDFMYVQALASHLGMAVNTVRQMIDFDPVTQKPRKGSEFPSSYKERPIMTARIRIPLSDIEAYKLRCLRGGSYFNLGKIEEDTPDEPG